MREEQTKCPAAGGLLCRPGDRFVCHRRPPPPPPARRTHQRSAQPDGGRDRACYRPRHCLQDECRWRPAPAHGDRRASRSTAPTVAATAPASAPPAPMGRVGGSWQAPCPKPAIPSSWRQRGASSCSIAAHRPRPPPRRRRQGAWAGPAKRVSVQPPRGEWGRGGRDDRSEAGQLPMQRDRRPRWRRELPGPTTRNRFGLVPNHDQDSRHCTVTRTGNARRADAQL